MIAFMLLEKAELKSIVVGTYELIGAQNGDAIATTAWGVVTALLTGNFKKAAREFKLLSILINSNPLGLMLASYSKTKNWIT